MPDRLPTPSHWPPTHLDHILTHPGTFIAAIWWAIYGVLLILLPGLGPSSIIDTFDPWAPNLVGALMASGGILTIWGTVTTYGKLKPVWLALRSGLTLSLGAWVAFCILLLPRLPEITLNLGSGLTHAFIALLSLISVIKAEQQVRQVVMK